MGGIDRKGRDPVCVFFPQCYLPRVTYNIIRIGGKTDDSSNMLSSWVISLDAGKGPGCDAMRMFVALPHTFWLPVDHEGIGAKLKKVT